MALDVVFRRVVELALASSLLAAGCGSAHDPGDPTDSPATRATTSMSAGRGSEASDAGTSSDASRPSGRPNKPMTTTPSTPNPPQPVQGGSGSSSAGSSGGDVDAGSEPDGGSSAPSVGPNCDVTGKWQPLAELKPATDFDYASLRTKYGYQMAEPATELSSVGEACANASGDECQTGLDAQLLAASLPLNQSCGMVGACQTFVVTTAGDLVSRYATRDELLEFLGELDSPQDVLLLLSYDGYTIRCGDEDSSVQPLELGASEVKPVAGGFEVTVARLVTDCPYTYARVVLHVTAQGEVEELSREELPSSPVCAGRRPEGWLGSLSFAAATPLADHFARMAELEAASVVAFEVLAEELTYYAAPAELIARARAAASDEVRHAERTSALARRFGATPGTPEIGARPMRSLEALARQNAIEGCVRETFGAAVGCYQARVARDPDVAALMVELSADETRHAELAIDIDAWLSRQLSPAARARVAAARAQAVAELSHELRVEPDADLQAWAGLPPALAAAKIHAALAAELWS